MKNVLIISPTTDYAGVGIGLKRAFDSMSTSWRARHVRRQAGPYGYPADIEWVKGDRPVDRQVHELFATADVVHVMDYPPVLERFTIGRQALVVQHLGTRYRNDPAGISAICQQFGAVEITDSFDLMVFPYVRWVPVAVDTKGLFNERLRLYRPSAEVVRIAHAPTDRATSDTDLVLATVERLKGEFDIEFDLIDHVTNAECISRKARADIYVDRFGVGFGVNSIECWAMGIPVVSGMSDEAAKARAVAEFGRLPWLDATPGTLYQRLRRLVADINLRREYSRMGLDHAERYHSHRAVVEKTTRVYAEAMTHEEVVA